VAEAGEYLFRKKPRPTGDRLRTPLSGLPLRCLTAKNLVLSAEFSVVG
jgi:hypothetical protein